MRGFRLSLGLTAAFLLAGSTSSRAQQAYIWVEIDNGSRVCTPVDIPDGIHYAHVVVGNSFPYQRVKFRVPLPAGAIVIAEQSSFPIIGNSQTGVEVQTGCQDAWRVIVLDVLFYAPAVNDVVFRVEPAPGDPVIRFYDCTDFPMEGWNQFNEFCEEGILAPYKPYPADGATDVPLDVEFGFTGPATAFGLADDAGYYLPWEGNVFWCGHASPCDFPVQASGLQPNTMYFWRVLNQCACLEFVGGIGDIWSFTTADAPLSTTTSTWGAVKALYRK